MAYAGLAVYDANGNQIFGTPTRTFKKLGSFKTSKALAPNKYGNYSVYQDYTDNNIRGKNICYYISGIKWIDNVSNARVYNSYPAIIKLSMEIHLELFGAQTKLFKAGRYHTMNWK